MSDTTLTRDAWDQLLGALDPDVGQAAARYERLRRCLIALYRGRGLPDPEDLADQALDGVARLLAAQRDVGTLLREVAHQVGDAAHRARRAHATAMATLPAPGRPDDTDDTLARLCRCLDELPELDRSSLLAYEGADGDRSGQRRALAAELGIPLNALRVRMHRLRVRLLARLGGARPAASPGAGAAGAAGAAVAANAVARRAVEHLGSPVADREPPEVPALLEPHAERRERLLVIAERLQRDAGRAAPGREPPAEPPRAARHRVGMGRVVRGGMDVEAGP